MVLTILLSAGTAVAGFTTAVAWGLRHDICRALQARRARSREQT